MTRAKRLGSPSPSRGAGWRYGDGGPSWRSMEPSRFLADLPPELFGEAVAREVRARSSPDFPRPAERGWGGEDVAVPRGPVIRRHPGALPQEPHIELDGADAPPARGPDRPSEPVVDYEFDQRPETGRAFSRGDRVVHPSLGEGVVLGADGAGRDAKITVRFVAGEKRVLARFLGRA